MSRGDRRHVEINDDVREGAVLKLSSLAIPASSFLTSVTAAAAVGRGAASQRSAEAEQLIGELAAALVELEDDDFAVALRLFRPALVRKFFAWLDRDREPEPTRMPATPRS